MENIVLDRKQLYDLVWSEPLLTLSKKYNISDVGLRKVCIRLGIPLPEIGYWNKVKAGKKVVVKPFPEKYAGEQNIRLALRNESRSEDEYGLSPQLALQRKIEADPSLDLNVKAELTNPDPLIISVQKTLLKIPKEYKDGDLLYSSSGELDIRVSQSQIHRVLCLMDSLIKIMRHRGHDFKMQDRDSYLIIGEDKFKMSLKEGYTTDPLQNHWERSTYYPTGVFTLKFEHWGTTVSVKDGQKTIEQQLSKIISKIEILAEESRLQREEHARQRAVRDEQERLQKIVSERRKTELAAFKQVIQDAERWKVTQVLREYIEAIEHHSGKENLTPEINAWLDWIKEKTNWFDPLIESKDDWLSNIDRDSILKQDLDNRTNSFTSYNEPPVKSKGWPLLPWYLKK